MIWLASAALLRGRTLYYHRLRVRAIVAHARAPHPAHSQPACASECPSRQSASATRSTVPAIGGAFGPVILIPE